MGTSAEIAKFFCILVHHSAKAAVIIYRGIAFTAAVLEKVMKLSSMIIATYRRIEPQKNRPTKFPK